MGTGAEMHHPDSSRVVHLKSDGLGKRGSGYLISKGLILTAGHAFVNRETAEVSERGVVYLGFDKTPHPARVVWRGADKVDAALLVLEDEVLEPVSADPSWASINNADLECVAFGYPKFLGGQREEFKGRIMRGASTPEQIHVEGRWIRSEDKNQWPGMSGAGLFCQGHLVGVVTNVAAGRLVAFPVAELLKQPTFPKHLLPELRYERFALWPEADQGAVEQLQPWTRKALLPSQRAPSELLLAENETVEFDDSLRERELSILREFTEDDGPGILIFHGAGGAGKTRLMLEWCRRQRAQGWLAGFVKTNSKDVTLVAKGESRRLLVVDYPENQVDTVVAICALMDSQRLSVRLVLLARSPGPWLDRLRQLSKSDLVRHALIYELEKLSVSQRRHTFQQACETFQEETAADEVVVTDDELAADDLPLYAHMRALLRGSYGVQRPSEDPERLLREVLAHERNYWPEALQDDAQRLMAAVTLLGPQQEGPSELLKWLRPALGLEDSLFAVQRAQLVDMAKMLYGRTGRVMPLQPDVLGEQLVLEAIEREQHLEDEAGQRAWLRLPMHDKAPPGSVGRALTIWSRLASRDVQQARAWLGEVLTENLGAWAKQAEDRNWTEEEQLDPRGHELAAAIASHGVELAEKLESQLPEQTAELLPFRVEVLRILLSRSEGVPESQRARRLDNYGTYLSEAGRVEEALTATLGAVNAYRNLVAANPNDDAAGLAGALSNLGVRLGQTGRVEEAEEATEEAIEVYRKLSEANPGSNLEGLATALSNFGNHLGSLGRTEQAMSVTLEAVEVFQKLAETKRDVHLGDLAMALSNLGNRLTAMGLDEQALAATQEAVDFYGELAAERPDAYLSDWASALNNLGLRQSTLGHHTQAIATMQKAVNIRRRLAEARPDAYLPGLASALNNLGSHLSSLGRIEDAVKATQESVEIHRAHKNPSLYLSELANALNNLGNHLSTLQRTTEAIRATQESVEVYRKLAEERPERYLIDLAAGLNNFGNRLRSENRVEEAIMATKEAVDIHRMQADFRSASSLQRLASALNNLGSHLASAGQMEDAIKMLQEAVRTYRSLTSRTPEVDLPGLASALSNLGRPWISQGRVGQAMEVAQEAVDILAKLVEVRPGVHLPQLARALGVRGSIEYQSGQSQEAVGTFSEILRLLWPLCERHPGVYDRLVFESATALSSACDVAGIEAPEDLEPLVTAIISRLKNSAK